MTAAVVVLALAAGALGALLRYGTTRVVARRLPPARLPIAVLVVNVVGSLVAGVAIALPVDADVRFVLLSGFAAGLTTFSTWTVETIQQVLDGRVAAAVRDVVLNLVLGTAAALAGWLAAAAILG